MAEARLGDVANGIQASNGLVLDGNGVYVVLGAIIDETTEEIEAGTRRSGSRQGEVAAGKEGGLCWGIA